MQKGRMFRILCRDHLQNSRSIVQIGDALNTDNSREVEEGNEKLK